MLINSVQNFRLNTFKKTSDNSKQARFRQNGLMSDTVSFGNASEYSIKEFNTSFPLDFKIASDLVKEPHPSPESLNIVKQRMEKHFYGILNLMKMKEKKLPSSPFIDEVLLKSNFLYQDLSAANDEAPQSVYKLDKELAKIDKSFSFSADFCLKNRKKLRISDKSEIYKMIANCNHKDIVKINFSIYFLHGNLDRFIFGDSFDESLNDEFKESEQILPDEEKYNPIDEAEDVLKERQQKVIHARDKINLNKPETIREGFEDLVKMDGVHDIKEALSDFTTGRHKLPKELKLNVLTYDIGSMLVKNGKEKALNILIADKTIPELLKNVLRGARL